MTMSLAAILRHVVLIMPSIAVSVCVESQLQLRRARTNLHITGNCASLQISSPTFLTLFGVGYNTVVVEKGELYRAEIFGLSE